MFAESQHLRVGGHDALSENLFLVRKPQFGLEYCKNAPSNLSENIFDISPLLLETSKIWLPDQ